MGWWLPVIQDRLAEQNWRWRKQDPIQDNSGLEAEKNSVETQSDGYQSSKIDWLSKVEDEGNKTLYNSGLEAEKDSSGIADMLEEASDQGMSAKGKWINLLQFGDAWNM